MIYDGLLETSQDEPFTEYGRLAETIEIPRDRSWVSFTLRPEARWHDGVPITADDVVYSFQLLTKSGNPFYRSYYANVEKAEKLGERIVKFTGIWFDCQIADSPEVEVSISMGVV